MSSQDESNQEPVGAPEGWPDGESPLRTEPVAVADEGMLIVDVGGFEGPLDLLLELARQHKVDLKHISILKLAEQYLEFIERARKLQLEIAADYLVMAAWLAYLKSRLLIPVPPGSEEQEPADLAGELVTIRREPATGDSQVEVQDNASFLSAQSHLTARRLVASEGRDGTSLLVAEGAGPVGLTAGETIDCARLLYNRWCAL